MAYGSRLGLISIGAKRPHHNLIILFRRGEDVGMVGFLVQGAVAGEAAHNDLADSGGMEARDESPAQRVS